MWQYYIEGTPSDDTKTSPLGRLNGLSVTREVNHSSPSEKRTRLLSRQGVESLDDAVR